MSTTLQAESEAVNKVTVRKLCRKDRRTLTNLIVKFAEKTGQHNLTNMIPADDKGDDIAREDGKSRKEVLSLTIKLLMAMIKYIGEELTPWFADLIGVPEDEFDDLPFGVEADIVDQLISMDGFVDFFLKVSQVRKKIQDLVLRF